MKKNLTGIILLAILLTSFIIGSGKINWLGWPLFPNEREPENRMQSASQNMRLGGLKTIRDTVVYESADLKSKGRRDGYIHKQSVEWDEGLSILVYHQVLPRELMTTATSTVSLENFERQMEYLAERNFRTLTSRELYEYLEGRLIISGNAVVITFDDGLLSSKQYAYPVLKKYGFTAPHHIISSRERGDFTPIYSGGKPLEYLTAEDLKEMKDVFTPEAHTDHLHELTEDSLGLAMMETEEELLADLESNLELVPDAVSIAYPYGQYNENFIAAAKKAGLLIGFTTKEGYANMNCSNFEVNRFGMTENRSFDEFTEYVDGDMTWPRKE